MHVVIVSSPGCGPLPHWSHATAAAVATRLVARADTVSWLAVVRGAADAGPSPASVERHVFPMRAPGRTADVAGQNRHLPLELALTHALRTTAARAVVHVGVGARGSPNVNWLADRLGAAAFAVARASEVVCHRGDLVDRERRACAEFLDPERCGRCCTDVWWRRARADDFRNRSDLLAGSLLASAAVFVPGDDDVRRLVDFGLPPRALRVGDGPDVIAAHIRA